MTTCLAVAGIHKLKWYVRLTSGNAETNLTNVFVCEYLLRNHWGCDHLCLVQIEHLLHEVHFLQENCIWIAFGCTATFESRLGFEENTERAEINYLLTTFLIFKINYGSCGWAANPVQLCNSLWEHNDILLDPGCLKQTNCVSLLRLIQVTKTALFLNFMLAVKIIKTLTCRKGPGGSICFTLERDTWESHPFSMPRHENICHGLQKPKIN